MHVRLGTRGSQLAQWQTNHIAARLHALGHTTEILVIRTTGDRMQNINTPVPPLADGKGLFTKEIEDALLNGSIDLAVHSLKDLPTEMDARFLIGAIPSRADARDVLLSPEWVQLHTLPEGSRVGTTSPRRQAQILAHRPDIRFVALRGNIDTRIRKMAAGECDALVLACAGVDRLGARLLAHVDLDPVHPEFNRPSHVECMTHADLDHLSAFDTKDAPGQRDWIRQRFEVDVLCPAPGQGALAVEVRADNLRAIDAVKPLDDAETRYAVEAERSLLQQLGGGCSLPVGALYQKGILHANVTAPHGDEMVQIEVRAEEQESAVRLGVRAAEILRDKGALDLLSESL